MDTLAQTDVICQPITINTMLLFGYLPSRYKCLHYSFKMSAYTHDVTKRHVQF